MGFSSSAAAAFTMAWFHPEPYHRVLGYSPTMVNQQWPHAPALPGGALADGMHDWALANEDMARVLAAKGYQYQFAFSRNAKHVDGPTEDQTLPEALEWLWAGYPSRNID
jgi:enterochelin esterase family protein